MMFLSIMTKTSSLIFFEMPLRHVVYVMYIKCIDIRMSYNGIIIFKNQLVTENKYQFFLSATDTGVYTIQFV